MRRTIDIPDDLESRLEAVIAARGEDAERYLVAAIAAAISRDLPDAPLHENGEKTLLDRFAGRLGRIHGGGIAWSELEAASDPD